MLGPWCEFFLLGCLRLCCCGLLPGSCFCWLFLFGGLCLFMGGLLFCGGLLDLWFLRLRLRFWLRCAREHFISFLG